MVTRKTLADVVRIARSARIWTQADLARKSKLSASLIADIERGETVRVLQLTASKLERALDLDLSQYVKRTAPREARSATD